MRYLLAPDSFKEAADARTVAEAMRRGILDGDPDAECRVMPLSDGGEGLTAALVSATAGELRSTHAHDALGRPVIAQFSGELSGEQCIGAIRRRDGRTHRSGRAGGGKWTRTHPPRRPRPAGGKYLRHRGTDP